MNRFKDTANKVGLKICEEIYYENSDLWECVIQIFLRIICLSEMSNCWQQGEMYMTFNYKKNSRWYPDGLTSSHCCLEC